MSVTRFHATHLVRTAVLATSVVALTFAGSVSTQANDSVKDDISRVSFSRVIDLSRETLPTSSSAQAADEAVLQNPDIVVESPGVLALPTGIELSPGETLQVNYADGVAVYEAITASCTITRVANTPTKYTPSTPDRATTTFSVSLTSGCSNGPFYGHLMRGTPPLDVSVASKNVVGAPGSTMYWATYKNCLTTAWHKYYSEVTGMMGVKTSKAVTLACG